MFKFSLSGIETIDTDFLTCRGCIRNARDIALRAVDRDWRDRLKEHIQKDVYDEYETRVYERRSENTLLGLPLESEERMVTDIQDFSASRTKLMLFYEPSTRNERYSPNTEFSFGDYMIEVIEIGYGYHFQAEEIPARPFFSNMLEEEFDDGLTEFSFVGAMNEAFENGIAIGGGGVNMRTTHVKADGTIKRDGESGYEKDE